MKPNLFLAALVLACVPAFAADPNPPPPPPPAAAPQHVCLRQSEFDGWGTRDKHSMIVDDRFGKKYLVSLTGICDDLDFAMGAGFRSRGGSMSCIDRGDHVVMRGGGVGPVANTCWVKNVQLYTKEMQEADRLARASKQPLQQY